MDLKCPSFLAAAFCCMLGVCSSSGAYAAPATDPCSLLTQPQISTVLGVNGEAGQRIAPKVCEWSAPNQQNSINGKKVVITISNERAFGYAKTPVVKDEKAIPAIGICDDAVYNVAPGVTPGLGTSLSLKKGGSYFVVHVYGFPEQAKTMEMEKTLALQACSKL